MTFICGDDVAQVDKLVTGEAECFLFQGDCLTLLGRLPKRSVQLIITSPPYNIGKEYEQQQTLKDYLDLQAEVIGKCVNVLSPRGSICWQVGNHIASPAEILPLDIPLHNIFSKHKLRLRNRVIWHFEHGLHCKKRFSGRYEVLMWYTKTDDYTFNLDPVRVPQKYPGKRHHKGPKVGELSGNPLGKNPSDMWIFPNVKHNHPEKTIHPCQFPIELVDRMVLTTTNEQDLVLDPFAGVSTSLVAAILRNRRACGAEIVPEYVDVSCVRVEKALNGELPIRPTGSPVYSPNGEKLAQLPPEFAQARRDADTANV